MPKKLDYPRASFQSCLELAKAVESLGGQCDMDTCAAKMNKKPSGAFNALIGATSKFGLITRKQGKLYITDSFEKMMLSYDEKEKEEHLRKFFLNIPLFNEIYSKYKDVKLPVDILDKALSKEFDVDRNISQRIAKYFTTGAKEVHLLNADNTFNKMGLETYRKNENINLNEIQSRKNKDNLVVDEDYSGSEKFIVHIQGKGMNSKIEINEPEDLIILNAMIKKIEKNLE